MYDVFVSAKMARIRITVLKQHYDAVLSSLHDAGVMQIEELSDMNGLRGGDSISYLEISGLAQRMRSLIIMLKPSKSEKRYRFDSIDELIELANSVDIDEKVVKLTKQITNVETERRVLADRLDVLSAMIGFDRDISILNSNRIVSFLIRNRTKKDIISAVAASIEQRVGDSVIEKVSGGMIISIQRSSEQKISDLINDERIYVNPIPRMSGGVEAAISRIEKEIDIIEQRGVELRDRLDEISRRSYPLVSALNEQLDIELKKQEVTNRLGHSERVVVIEGWIPERDIHRIQKIILKLTDGRAVIDRLKTDEIPPTKLDNPGPSRLFEFFIRFYSLPKSNEIDPTVMFAVIFPIFFGFMVGDAGYGIVMLIFALWLSHRIRSPPKVSRIPRKISSFVHTIISDNGLLFISRAIIPGSIIAILLGVLFNNYFGFQLPFYSPIFNVQLGLSKLLVVAGWIGVFMVSFGLVLGFINNISIRNMRHAIAKIGWLMIALGIVFLGLIVLHKGIIGTSNPLSILYIGSIIAGVGIVLYGEGVQALMEVPSIISHILSYTRLVGILLASVILAEVIDMVFIKGVQGSIPLAVLGVVILAVGQIFNLMIAVFEPGIQGARLIYVEFFSKFFSGNGKEFAPFKNERKRTLSRFDIEKF